MEDITPQLIQQVTEEFRRAYAASDRIQELLEKVKQKTATYAEAQQYAIEVSRLIGNAYEKYISSATLPDGKMYYNIANRLIPETLDENHKLVSEYAADVQAALNKKANIGLQAQTAELDQDRVDGLVELASNAEQYDDISEQLLSAFENFNLHIADETIRLNADLHYGAGFSPEIIRKTVGKCCDWCRRLAGVRPYPVEKEIYMRHANCRCMVLYDPADGRKMLQNVHTREVKSKEEHIAEYKERERKRKLEDSASKFKRTFQPVPQDKVVAVMREDAAEWVKNLSDDERLSIRKYTGNSDSSPKFYERMNQMLRGESPGNDSLRYHVDIISNALKRSTIGESIICYRGMDVNPVAGAEIGSVIGFSQFTSTSLIPTKSFNKGVSITMYVPNGTNGAAYIEELSEFPKQREILFDKDCRYMVLSNKENHVELVVI